MILNKAIIAVGLISLNLLFALPLSAQAQNTQESSKCTASVKSVKNKITKIRKVKIANVFKSDISTDYKNYPKNRPFSYSFGLRGVGAEAVLSSDQLLTSFSRDILTNCTNVSQVVFGLHETDHIVVLGLMPENKIDVFKCVDPGTYKTLPWGYVVCI
jgi:hypothetical protein